jgi:hypothetical protein
MCVCACLSLSLSVSVCVSLWEPAKRKGHHVSVYEQLNPKPYTLIPTRKGHHSSVSLHLFLMCILTCQYASVLHFFYMHFDIFFLMCILTFFFDVHFDMPVYACVLHFHMP